MTFPVFASGDVLNASDMNAVGLWLVKTQTIGTAVSSVTVTGAFSANYDSYKITISGGASSAANPSLRMTLGATASGYAMQLIYGTFGNTPLAAGSSAQSSWLYAGSGTTTTLSLSVDLHNPFLTEFTWISGNTFDTGQGGAIGGYLNDTTSYTAFTITPSTGTITGGTIRVYGYKN